MDLKPGDRVRIVEEWISCWGELRVGDEFIVRAIGGDLPTAIFLEGFPVGVSHKRLERVCECSGRIAMCARCNLGE